MVKSFVPGTSSCAFAMPVKLLCRLLGCLSRHDLKKGICYVFSVVVWNAYFVAESLEYVCDLFVQK